MKFRETERIDEASGTYHGALYSINGANARSVFMLGVALGSKNIKYAMRDASVFIKDDDMKKIKGFPAMVDKNPTPGEWSFATDEFLSDKLKAKHGDKKSKRK